MSGAKTGTPQRLNSEMRRTIEHVLPEPVAPVIKPCRFAYLDAILTRLPRGPVPRVIDERALP